MFSSYKVVNPSLGYRALAASPCFAKLAYSHGSLALSRRCRSRWSGPSVPFRWRPARDIRPAFSLRSGSARRAAGPALPRARPRASVTQVWLVGLRLAAFHRSRKSRHPKQRGKLPSSRLTLPSSGPAYGGPLKSNVRPRFKPHASHASCLKLHPGSTSAVRCAGCACARNTGCRRRFEFCASAQGHCRD